MAGKRVLVVGAGVSGLTTAILLQEAEHSVTIRAPEASRDTTSAKAAAIWEPYLPQLRPNAGEALKNIRRWGKQAYDRFRSDPALRDERFGPSGVTWARILELKREEESPAWRDDVDHFTTFAHAHMPAGYESYAQGFAFDTPIIDMSRYLPYLEARFRSAKGSSGQADWIDRRPVCDLATELPNYDAVINCTGLDGGALAGDEVALTPALGQVVRIQRGTFRPFRFAGQEIAAIVDDGSTDDLAYIVPRTDDIVLGGTYIPRRYEDYAQQRGTAGYTPSGSQPPDNDIKTAILQRCARLAAPLDPAFAMSIAPLVSHAFADELAEQVGQQDRSTPVAIITSETCGLRPSRDGGPRVECDPRHRGLIHNYGHAGAGVTLSWGCAARVLELLG